METLNRYIEHTNLRPEATEDDIKRLCAEAKAQRFLGVCVNPVYVAFCSEQLRGTAIKTVSVAGFPLGQSLAESKAFEAARAEADGADEIDMVISVSAIKNRRFAAVLHELETVRRAVQVPLKVILETGLLTAGEIRDAVEISADAGADFVKTSTGFLAGGATVEAVLIMAEAARGRMGVKASGGIASALFARQLIDAGATRLGTSKSLQICAEQGECP